MKLRISTAVAFLLLAQILGNCEEKCGNCCFCVAEQQKQVRNLVLKFASLYEAIV